MIVGESSLPLLPTKGLTSLHKIHVWVNHTKLHDDDDSLVDETLVNRSIALATLHVGKDSIIFTHLRK